MARYQVWYMKPDWFRSGIFGAKPDPTDLKQTHVHLRDIESAADEFEPEWVFQHMQAERWSPNGEARFLIRTKGLQHTSMSVGDVLVHEGDAYLVVPVGFRRLGSVVKSNTGRRVPTKAQQRALKALWERSADRTYYASYLRFRRKAFWESGRDGALMVPFAGMIVGIEADGLVHS